MGKDKIKKESIFRKLFANNAYCWLAILCTAGVMMLVYYCFNLFPFGETTILRMDLYHQYGPLFAEFYDRVMNLKSFLYSWNTGLGSPFLGNYFNYLSSPAAFLILILGHRNMPEAIAGMILIKAALSAGAFTYYLKKSRGRHDFTTAAFGVLYSMCGYFVAYYWNVMWIDAMVYFPLIIYGIERIIDKRKPSVYIAFLALTLWSNYYMGYMTCIFSVIYFIVYFFSHYDFTSFAGDAKFTYDDSHEKQYAFKDKLKSNIFIRSGVTFAFASLAAAGLVAAALLPVYYILRSSSATSGTMPDGYRVYFSVFDFLANHFASVDPTIRSSGEDVLPNVYCGIGTLILVPLYIFSKRISLKEKVCSIFTLGLLFFSFNINYLNFIWHGFHFPNDLPYRFSFMYCFILLVMAYKAFENLGEYSGRQILGVGVALVFAVIAVQKIGSKNADDLTELLSVIFAVTYCLIFYLLKDLKKQKAAISVILLCCVIAELACSNTNRYSMNQIKSTFTGDYDSFLQIKSMLDEREDGNDRYRMELTYNRARMDPAWFGYNGVSTFSSMAYEKMSNMQSNLGLYSNYINSYTYYMQTPVYNMMNSLKYIVDNDPKVNVSDDYYTSVAKLDKYTAYENKYWLPIAMAVDPGIKEWYAGYTNPFSVQNEWFEFSTGVEDVFEMMPLDSTSMRYFNLDEITAGFETGDLYFQKTGAGEGELDVDLWVPETRHCYLFVDSDSFDSIVISKPDGSSVTQETDEPYIYDLGILNPEDSIEIQIKIPEDGDDYGYMNFYPYSVNEEKLSEGYEILKANGMHVESFEDTRITGTITAAKDMVMFTSIPYDKGWSVKIDGKEIKNDDCIALQDAYLCFNLPKGTHKIELSFTQRGLFLGLAVSAATAMLLIAAAIVFSLIRKKRRENYDRMCESAETDYQNRKLLAERAKFTSYDFDDIDLSELDMTELTGRQDIYIGAQPADEAQTYAEDTAETPVDSETEEITGGEESADEEPAEELSAENPDEIQSSGEETTVTITAGQPAEDIIPGETDAEPSGGESAENTESAGEDSNE